MVLYIVVYMMCFAIGLMNLTIVIWPFAGVRLLAYLFASIRCLKRIIISHAGDLDCAKSLPDDCQVAFVFAATVAVVAASAVCGSAEAAEA